MPVPPSVLSDVPSSEAGPPKRRRLPRYWGAWAVLLGFGATVIGIVVVPSSRPGAVEVVESFFTALQRKDVEGALKQVDDGSIPYGAEAVFLHPDAIADGWKLVDVDGNGVTGTGTHRTVTVTIETDGRAESGEVAVTRTGGEWLIEKPFIPVTFPDTGTDYLRVNDRSVVPEELFAADPVGRQFANPFPVFPGPTGFFGDLGAGSTPQVLWPSRMDGGDTGVDAPAPDLGDVEPDAAPVQETVDTIVDDCVHYEVAAPANCPFGISSAPTVDGATVKNLRNLSWSVDSYPQVTPIPPGHRGGEFDDPSTDFGVELADPGRIVLTATATGGDGNAVELTADCTIDPAEVHGLLGVDGDIDWRVGVREMNETAYANTCSDATGK